MPGFPSPGSCMRHPSAVAFAVLIGLVAVVTPIWISIQLSWRQALANENSVALSYGKDVLRRTEETGLQIGSGIKLINGAHNPPCSPPDLALMRKVDVGSSYIQAVGRITGDTIVCTSLVDQGPIQLGPPTLSTASGPKSG